MRYVCHHRVSACWVAAVLLLTVTVIARGGIGW